MAFRDSKSLHFGGKLWGEFGGQPLRDRIAMHGGSGYVNACPRYYKLLICTAV